MQDNLEFLQWVKRFWDQSYSGQQYDAVARRKGQGGEPLSTMAPLSGRTSGAGMNATTSRGRTPVGGARVAQNSAELISLQNHVAELTAQMEGLEKERDFYFAKVSLRKFT